MHMFFLLGATLVFMTCALALHSYLGAKSKRYLWLFRCFGLFLFLYWLEYCTFRILLKMDERSID